MWYFYKLNYYGGRIYRHPEGWRAIEVFNYYYRPIGFSVSDETGAHIGYVRTIPELP